MRRVLEGSHAVSHAVELARVKVISAYPITPQTHIVERLAELVADGVLDARFIRVESEHSAMAAVIGAASAGARSFTASSSHGLALMHEMLHWAAGARLPIVMAEVNRAMGPGWNIWADQTDSLSQRDTGWMQLYCEDVQEVLDTILIAYKLAERVSLPAMVVLDAFFLSHTYEPVEVPDQDEVDAFLPAWEPTEILDPSDPRAFNQLASPEYYMEFRYKIQQAMEEALRAHDEIDAEFGQRFGRSYGAVRRIPCREGERAPLALVTTGSVTGTARVAQATLREKGTDVDVVKLKLFRPFPHEEVRRVLGPYERVVVLDRNISFGSGGIFAGEIRAALAGLDRRPRVYPFVAGLGGRDITPQTIESIVARALGDEPPADILWEGLKL
ncbi:MAG: pyruvate ferredoxin oxidoreductase [Deltaproteobacteria bacterium]|nr:pyruvate ferredoxin oxidoreductase [Deltaproteobacteria bacterium]